MSFFKKFTDLCAGIAAFFASIFFIRKYMAFVPEEPPEPSKNVASDTLEGVTDAIEKVTEKFPSKLEQFLEPTEKADYSMLIPLIFLLLLSALLGRVFKRLPYVCFGISLLPAMMIAYMYEAGTIYEQIGLFLILGALHVVGNLVECIIRDREDGRHRASIAAKISTAAPAIFCFFVMWKGAQTSPEDIEKINHFEDRVFFGMTEADVEIMTRLGIMLLVILAITLILHNVYFIDAILSVIPFGYVVYQVAGEFLTFAPTVIFALTLFCLLAHVLLCLCENNLSRKEQLRAKGEPREI